MNLNKVVFRFVSISFSILVILLVLIGFVKIGTYCYDFGYRVFTEAPVDAEPGRDVIVQISDDMSDMDIAKELKEKGVPVVGSYCTYFPKEIAMAMGAGCVSLCSTSDETIPEAEKDLPKNLCPLIKSSYGFAKTDKCPFFYFSDVVVGETTCDGKKKMYEYMSEFKDVFIMELPNSQREPGLQLWKGEIIRFKEYLEQKFGVTITEEQIREAVKTENQALQSLKKLYEVMKHDPAPIKGQDLFKVLYGSTFKFDRSLIPGEVDALTAKIEKEYAATHIKRKTWKAGML